MITLLLALAAAPADTTSPPAYTPHRVYDSHHKRFSDFETLAAEASKADVVLMGEQHDDPGTHRMEIALLESIGRRRSDVVLALEMFERDVQPVLDSYLEGKITEDAFLKASRPWPNYAADYRPLVEYAKARGWRVVAGNVPRKIASTVFSKGIDAVSQLPDSSRRWAAEEFQCPKGDYADRVAATLKEHPAGPGPAPTEAEMTRMGALIYQAQCVKDETMAESIARARGKGSPLVIHYNGAFHTDYGAGTAERVRRRLPKAKVLVISAIPVADLDAAPGKPDRKLGEWLVYTLKPPAK
ncbi:MAG: ChaN family lipoprotein [Gemmatimonadota bacterium]